MRETESGEIITEAEFEVVKMLRRLRPYGKLEIAKNQNGFEVAATLINPERKVLEIKQER